MRDEEGTLSKDQGRHVAFGTLFLASVALFSGTIVKVVELSIHDDRYTYLLAVPLITAFLLYSGKKQIFADSKYDSARALPPLVFAIAIYAAVELAPRWRTPNWFTQDFGIRAAVCSMCIVWLSIFLFCYGRNALRRSRFPFLFLLLLVPPPNGVLDKIVVFLQQGSARVTYLLFQLLRIPVLAQGVNLSLPGVEVEVAKECSGIRSCESLVITSILISYYLLRSAGNRILLVLISIPIAIVKNAIRITTISCLGLYVNRSFFYGSLHRNGGLPFSLIALAMLSMVLFMVRRLETHTQTMQASEKVQC